MPCPATSATRRTARRSSTRAVSELGGLDILVNNAAYQMAQPGGIADITTEQFDRVMKTNLYAMFWLCRAAVPHMRPGATIINTASIQAYQSVAARCSTTPRPRPASSTSPRRWPQDLAEKGIRVNAVAPGPIWTPLIPATMPAEKVEVVRRGHPAGPGRASRPSWRRPTSSSPRQESSYITGEVLGVTGGKPVS